MNFRVHLFSPIITAILALCLAINPVEAAKRVALIIGNSNYADVKNLSNPSKDAQDIAAALKRLDFQVVEHNDLTYMQMRTAFIKFGRQSRDAEMAIFYFAGHGIEVDGTNWLIPVDAKLGFDADTVDEAWPLPYIIDKLSHTRKLGLIILDACRDNPFKTKMIQTPGTKRTINPRSVSRGFTRVEVGGNILVAYSATEGTTAEDGVIGQNSPYAKALLQHIETPNLDIRRLFGKVRDTVKITSKSDPVQVPNTYGTMGGEKVMLNIQQVKKKIAIKPVSPGQDTVSQSIERVTENSFWNSIRDQNRREYFLLYLKKYPSGHYSGIAKLRLAEIEGSITTATLDEKLWRRVKQTGDIASFEDYLRDSQDGKHRKEANERIDNLRQQDRSDWIIAKSSNDRAKLNDYIKKYPNGQFLQDAKRIVRLFEDEGILNNRGDINKVQSRLFELNYDPGPIDGRIGGRTRAAIKLYQEDQNLKVNGNPTIGVLRALNEHNTPDTWGVITLSTRNQKRAISSGHKSRKAAQLQAAKDCPSCNQNITFAAKECAALAMSTSSWGWASKSDINAAKDAALRLCGSDRKCSVKAAVCSDGTEELLVN